MKEIEKAIEVMKETLKMQKSALGGLPTNYQPMAKINEDIKATELAIKALEAQQADAWIPITERWPDKKGYYLTTYREWTDGEYLPKYDDTYIRILRYQNAVFKMPVNCDKKAEDDTHREVIAWKPLPEPYKELATDNNVVTKSGKDNKK